MNMLTGGLAGRFDTDELGVRPEHLLLTSGEGEWSAHARYFELLGAQTVYCIELPDNHGATAVSDDEVVHQIGATVGALPRLDKLHCFREQLRQDAV